MYLKHICDLEIKILSPSLILSQRIDDEISQHIVCSDHLRGNIEKLRKNHKVDRDIIPACRKNLMPCILIQEEKLTPAYPDLFAIDDMRHRALADVHHFHIIMPVHGKMRKPCMCPHGNQLTCFQQLRIINGEFLPGGI